jgi:hypothetical protein
LFLIFCFGRQYGNLDGEREIIMSVVTAFGHLGGHSSIYRDKYSLLLLNYFDLHVVRLFVLLLTYLTRNSDIRELIFVGIIKAVASFTSVADP